MFPIEIYHRADLILVKQIDLLAPLSCQVTVTIINFVLEAGQLAAGQLPEAGMAAGQLVAVQEMV